MNGRETLDRDPPLHEQAAFLALGLLCSAVGLKVRLGNSYDDHRGTDLFLIRERSGGKHRFLRINLTEGHHRTVSKKFRQNRKHREQGGYWVWIIVVPRESVVSLAAHPCFIQAWDRLKSAAAAAFSPEDICPDHGRDCALIQGWTRGEEYFPGLIDLGLDLSGVLRDDYRRLFGDPRELRAHFE
jgi:hypothetical protein